MYSSPNIKHLFIYLFIYIYINNTQTNIINISYKNKISTYQNITKRTNLISN